MRLKGKTTLITGAGQGIGQAVAELYAKEGAFVIVTDINEQIAKAVAETLGKNAVWHKLDVKEENDWKAVASAYPSLDILVNNAGITGFQEGFGEQDPENVSLADWSAVHAVNVDGTFLGCKYAILAMKEKGGAIINISSRSGLVGIPGAAAYASSKAAVRNHTKTVALYCCEKGYRIRCNSIHPAAILTPMWEPMLGNDPVERKKRLDAISAEIPMKKIGMPEDVAYAALFLASDESKYITGIELNVDGGLLAGASATPKKN